MGIPRASTVTLTLAGVEIITGVMVLATANPWAIASQALLYTAFLIWVSLALVLDIPMASCGCLGRPDTPPYWGHLVLNGVGAAVTAGTMFYPPSVQANYSISEIAASATVVAVGVYLAWQIIDSGARAHGAIHQ